jgi:hypothetical protein
MTLAAGTVLGSSLLSGQQEKALLNANKPMQNASEENN